MVDFVLKKGCEVYVSENFSDVHPDVIATSSSEMYKSVDFCCSNRWRWHNFKGS